MSEFLALNFDFQSSPAIDVTIINEPKANSGWGFGWYPNDDYTAMIIKDITQDSHKKLSQSITDWVHFRSTTFMCKTKGAPRQYTLHDVQPFKWSFAGTDWLFMHNGRIDKDLLEKKHIQDSFLTPVGNSDSELLFCYLLGKINGYGAKELIHIDGNVILQWFAELELEMLGSMDVILSDHNTMLVYHGLQSQQTIYTTRITPPNNQSLLAAESISIQLDDPKDYYHTCFIVSSEVLTNTLQQKLQLGELILIRGGVIVWQGLVPAVNGEIKQEDVTKIQQKISSNLEQQQCQQQNQTNQNIVNIRSITQRSDGTPLECKTYDVTHTTIYEYDHPVEHSTHTFRLQPTEDSLQELICSEIEISVNGERIQYEDVFGNQAIYYMINEPYDRLEITCKSHVKIYEKLPDTRSAIVRRSSIPLVWMPWQHQMMSPYLLPVELPESQLQLLTEYAMSFVERCDYNILETLKDMNYRIYKDFEYVQGSTSIMTTPFEVFESRKGVCQDFTNLFICLSQLLSIPARYRMGYIFTGGNYENKIQSEASHAWAEVYLPFTGWKGFDPTNGCLVDQNHIRVACGRNYRDASPTTGAIFKGGGGERLSIDVKILPE